MGSGHGEWRIRYRDLVAGRRDEVAAELGHWFDGGHVQPQRGRMIPEYEPWRRMSQPMKACMTGPSGCERLEPDVWFHQLGLSPATTIEDVLVSIEALLSERRRLARAVRLGGTVLRDEVLRWVSEPGEAAWVREVFGGSGEVVDDRPLKLVDSEERCPRLSNSDPALIAEARDVAARLVAADLAAGAIRDERDVLVIRLKRAGWGYVRISSALGISKRRAQELAAGVTKPAAMAVGSEEF